MEKNDEKTEEYYSVLEQITEIREKYNSKNNFSESYETNSSIIRSNVQKNESRSCKFCGKEEFLFTGVDENSMGKYGCCRECFFLFLE